MIGGIYFAGAPFAGMLKAAGAAAAALAGAASITFTGTGALDAPPQYLAASASITWTAAAAMDSPPAYLAGEATIVWTTRGDAVVPIETGIGITIDGVPVQARVRVAGVTIHDILNDAPNTASFVIEGDAPAVGQRVRITMGNRLLFAGALQTIDQAYESLPKHRAWHLTAIDDTAEANARRPFGTWFETSATTIAQSLTTTFAPTFSTAGIEAGLPEVTIVFDGADPLIACLARLATAVGGYCKIEDRVVYLFTEDLSEPPDPLDDVHRFLTSPPISMNTDSSQLRTRVYGKGYGETVPTDLNAGETLLPIQDGALFPPLGGTAIVGLTAEGAQSDKISFTGVVLKSGGSLVGTGSSPTNPPAVALQGGAGVTSGDHTLSVAYRTAAGQSLAGPPASITAGTHAPPPTAPTANPATNGTGPDQGSHDYSVEFVTAYGVTGGGPVSNAVTTSAASGQLPAPGAPNPQWPALQGAGMTDGHHAYRATFLNANGETQGGASTGYYGPLESKLEGNRPPVDPNNPSGTGSPSSGGNLTAQTYYTYKHTYTTAQGESLAGVGNQLFLTTTTDRSANVILSTSPDDRVIGRKVYRALYPSSEYHLCGTVTNNTAGSFYDQAPDSTVLAAPLMPTQDTTAIPGTMVPYNRIQIYAIPTGPAGTTARKLYRAFNFSDQYYLITTLSNNTATEYLDQSPNNFGAVAIPSSNTTGTAVQRIPVINIPIGPASVTGRNLYRRFNGAGAFRLVTAIGNNSSTTFNDSVSNAALGATLGAATAIGNQILVTLPIGASAVTTRELYMSPVGGPRRLIQTIADNTTPSVLVTIADGAITGALEPSADSSGLQQPHGQVNPGASVLPVASSAPFRPAGGWVTLGGGQVVKHTGISGNTLIGIPATGSGAITTAVIYGQQAIPAPMLIGVTGLTRPMLKGSAVHIWVQRDDLLAQAEHAARTGGDGIVEFLIVDQRRGVDSLVARCDADLALFSRPIVTVGYATRDLKTKSGKSIVINLPSQGIVTTLTIQDVTITEIDIAKGLLPRFTVKASNVRFSLEDMLRRLAAVGPVSVNA